MNGKRWFLMFLSALLLVFAVWAGLNLLADPFGVFGTDALAWDAYSQTLNPRAAKTAYIAKRPHQFDTYIIGSSSAASYDPDMLETYLGGSCYNMFHYGADTSYDRALVEYLLAEDRDVKNIFLVLGLNEANQEEAENESITYRGHYKVTGESRLSFYGRFLFASPSFSLEKLRSRVQDTVMPQTFDVFLPETGCYDKRLRDVESIGALDPYLVKNGADFPEAQTQKTLLHIDRCAENVSAIRNMCEESGVNLTVVLSPVSEQQLAGYTDETLDRYFSALSQVTEFWNFAISPITYDPRYFYDVTHTRNATGNMVLARIFGDDTLYAPAEFGEYCSGDFTSAAALQSSAQALAESVREQTIPILLYHHLSDDPEADKSTTMSPALFAHHMAILKAQGYETVTFRELTDYVESGTALPKKPVLITFDDGYLSNYEYAYPALKELGYSATVFAIGCSVGRDKYKDTDHDILPHFGKAEIQEMAGTVEIGSHTYDMHQWEPFEASEPVRKTILPLEGESEADYIAALTADTEAQSALFAELGLDDPTVLAFPMGEHTPLADVVLKACGYQVTLTIDETRINTLVPGLPQSLIDLGRMTVRADTTDEELLDYLNMQS